MFIPSFRKAHFAGAPANLHNRVVVPFFIWIRNHNAAITLRDLLNHIVKEKTFVLAFGFKKKTMRIIRMLEFR